ncbi:hypothetical protein HanIR_Chr16g0844821 [Helianthus annuus]|nr:hypothetical protein HanIR_Chr16g0844821 [Helianthus annuus]
MKPFFFFIVSSKFLAEIAVSGRKSSSESAIFTLFSAIHHIATMSRHAIRDSGRYGRYR